MLHCKVRSAAQGLDGLTDAPSVKWKSESVHTWKFTSVHKWLESRRGRAKSESVHTWKFTSVHKWLGVAERSCATTSHLELRSVCSTGEEASSRGECPTDTLEFSHVVRVPR